MTDSDHEELGMPLALSETLAYRGMSIAIEVEPGSDSVYGRDDVSAGVGFKGWLACGSAQRAPEDILDRMRCLAKAKVDAWSIADSALKAVGSAPFENPQERLPHPFIGSQRRPS